MREHHVIIGAGVAGCVAALIRVAAGYEVTVIERNSITNGVLPICRQTSNVVSEFHSGAEYPFDEKSAKDCLDGRIRGEKFFPKVIFGGKDFTRIVASYEMCKTSENIIEQCKHNLKILKSYYEDKIRENPQNAVFGSPSEAFKQVNPDSINVKDAGAAFITPQRGINPAVVSALLEKELISKSVNFITSKHVTKISKVNNEMFSVHLDDGNFIIADQVLITSAHNGFLLARTLNEKFFMPPIYTALRDILFVLTPNWQNTRYTILKLENQFGGMFSPMNREVAMIYHPPAAHVAISKLNAKTGSIEEKILTAVNFGHEEQTYRANWALDICKKFYPELDEAKIAAISSKIALNTSNDSRIRRKIGIIKVCNGCQLIALPKWTMAVSIGIESLSIAINYSINKGVISEENGKEILKVVNNYVIQTPPSWNEEKSNIKIDSERHSIAMGLPIELGTTFENS